MCSIASFPTLRPEKANKVLQTISLRSKLSFVVRCTTRRRCAFVDLGKRDAPESGAPVARIVCLVLWRAYDKRAF
jgi:hypothetical protein